MIKFNWSVKKCLEFVAYKRPETNPKPHFIKQLMKAAKFLHITEPASKTIDDRWCNPNHQTTEEAVITNTFLNSHTIRYQDENEHEREETLSPISKLMSNTANSLNQNNNKSNKKKLVWNPQLTHVYNENNSSQKRTSDSNKDKLTSILKVRPSTPTVLPNNSKHQTSSQNSNISNDNEDRLNINDHIDNNKNMTKLNILSNTNNNNSMPDIIRLHHDESNNDLHHSNHLNPHKPTIADLDKVTKDNTETNDYLDSTLSYLADRLNTLRVERKSVTNQSFIGSLNKNKNKNINNSKGNKYKKSLIRNKLSSSTNNINKSSSNNNHNSLWSSSRPRTKRNSWSSLNEDSSTTNLNLNSLMNNNLSISPSHLNNNNQISGLRVIGRSNDPIKAQASISPFSSTSYISPTNSNNNRLNKSSSKKKYNTKGIRKGPAPLYSSKPTPRRSPLHRNNTSSRGLSSSLMNDLRNTSNSSFPARRLIKTTSEERLTALKSHHFKSRYGMNNNHLSSTITPKRNRPRSAPKGKGIKKGITSTINTRPRSNSAKPPSKIGGTAKSATSQFRRVGW